MRKAQVVYVVVFVLVFVGASASAQRSAKSRAGILCPDPTVACRTSVEFQPYQLPFRVPSTTVIYETEPFYAVILKSMRDASEGADCNVFVPETDRLAAQSLFPHNKVFASRCFESGDLYYTNVAHDRQFMAVYAGHTLAEAKAMLAKVRATGKYPGANLRRMRAGLNGT